MPSSKIPPAAHRKALEVKRSAVNELKAYPNVTGVGVGYKEIKGRRTRSVAIRVYVRKKLPLSALARDERLPKSIRGVPVDVIQAEFRAHQDPSNPADHRLRFDPLQGGISVGSLLLGGSGTLGCSVYGNDIQEDLILSNWHVLCGRPDCTAQDPIIQPGTGGGDLGTPSDVVATLLRWALTDEVDAAVARLTGDRFLLKQQCGLGSITAAVPPTLGMTVHKSGRTTGVTTGTITDVSADISVDYEDATRSFVNQLAIQNGDQVSRPGDSGSIWVDDEGNAVGLNFAGTSDGKLGNANPILSVLAALDLDLRVGVTMHDFVALTAKLLLC